MMKKRLLLLNRDMGTSTYSNYIKTEPILESREKNENNLPRITSQKKIFEKPVMTNTKTHLNKLNHECKKETPYHEYKKGSEILNVNYFDPNSSIPDNLNSSDLANTSAITKKKALLTKLYTNLPLRVDELKSTITENDFKGRQRKHSRNINLGIDQAEQSKIENTKKILNQTINRINYPFQKKKLSNGPTLLENESIRSKLLEVHNYPVIFPDEDIFDKTRKGAKEFLLSQEQHNPEEDDWDNQKFTFKKKKKIKIVFAENNTYNNYNSFPLNYNSYLNYSKKNLNYISERILERKKRITKEPNYLYKFNKPTDENSFNSNTGRSPITKITGPLVVLNTSKLNEILNRMNSKSTKNLGQ